MANLNNSSLRLFSAKIASFAAQVFLANSSYSCLAFNSYCNSNSAAALLANSLCFFSSDILMVSSHSLLSLSFCAWNLSLLISCASNSWRLLFSSRFSCSDSWDRSNSLLSSSYFSQALCSFSFLNLSLSWSSFLSASNCSISCLRRASSWTLASSISLNLCCSSCSSCNLFFF